MPDVAIGLCAVLGSLAAVALRRRTNIARRAEREHGHGLRPARVGPGRDRGGEPIALG